jgi:hypothetical protein
LQRAGSGLQLPSDNDLNTLSVEMKLSDLPQQTRQLIRETLELGLAGDVARYKREYGDDAIAVLLQITGQMEIDEALGGGGVTRRLSGDPG